MRVAIGNATYSVSAKQVGYAAPWFTADEGGRLALEATVTCSGADCGADASKRKAQISGLLVGASSKATAGLSYVIIDPSGAHKAVVGVLVFSE